MYSRNLLQFFGAVRTLQSTLRRPKNVNVVPRLISNSSFVRQNNSGTEDSNETPVVSEKYIRFEDSNFDIILDCEEEKLKHKELIQAENMKDPYEGINLNRGVEGVFDVEDIVYLLRKEKCGDICVLSLPEGYNYVDYLVIITSKSYRHMLAVAELVKKVYKIKRNSTDLIPTIEGKRDHQWIALDLGNIALHIFSKTARRTYDIEALWAVGNEYDEKYNEPDDPVIDLLNRHTVVLNSDQSTEKNSEINIMT